MEKCYKTFGWILCAAVIVVGLGVAVYFIVVDAMERKGEDCLVKYFDTPGLNNTPSILKKFNITERDPAAIRYSTEECQWYVERVRQKTLTIVGAMKINDCVKERFSNEPFLDIMMLYVVLEKIGRDRSQVLAGAMFKASKDCEPMKNASTVATLET